MKTESHYKEKHCRKISTFGCFSGCVSLGSIKNNHTNFSESSGRTNEVETILVWSFNSISLEVIILFSVAFIAWKDLGALDSTFVVK